MPAPLRDVVYRGVAAVRHRLAGRSNACEMPPPEIRARMNAATEGKQMINLYDTKDNAQRLAGATKA